MEDYLFQGDLQDIQINNNDKYEDFPLLCDFHSSKTSAFHRIFPYIIIIISILMSLYFPETCTHFTHPIELNKNNQVNVTYSNISPLNSFIDVYVIPKANNKEEIPINSSIFTFNIKNNTVVESTNSTIISTFHKKTQIMRFNILKFDKINFVISFNSTSNLSQIEVVTANNKFQLAYILFEAFLSIISLFYLIDFLININSTNVITFEQNLSVGLAMFLLGFCDFLGFVDMFSSGFINVLRKLLLRDIFYSYYFFYISAIFVYFYRDPTEMPSLSVAIPFAVMLCTMLFLMGTAACINFNHMTEYNPLFSGPLSDFNSYEIGMFTCYVVVFLYHFFEGKKEKKPTTSTRFENYQRMTLPFIVILGITFVIGIFIPENSFASFVPLTIIFSSSISLIHSHKVLKEELVLYDKAIDMSENGNDKAEKGMNSIQAGATIFDDDDLPGGDQFHENENNVSKELIKDNESDDFDDLETNEEEEEKRDKND